jgi:lysophospholipase L1-like esterase
MPLPRRWTALALAVAAAAGLACEGGGRPGTGPTDPPAGDLPSSMAALGDSITVGVGSCVALVVCRRNSWSTGDGLRVDSHYRRLRAANGAMRGHVDNLAVAGSRADGLAAQAARVPSGVDYVTVLIGANDACRGGIDDMTPVPAFRDAVDAGLAAVKSRAHDATVLVASVPDLYRLWEIGRGEDRVVRVWARGVCPALLADPQSDTEDAASRRATFGDRVDAYNRQLAAACKAYGRRCHWDGGAVHRVRFTLDMLNPLDYFHPDADGQNALADATYEPAGVSG